MIYVITGGPATGKGTRSKAIASKLSIPHVSTGDLLRELAKTDDGVREELSKGHLIKDEVITELLFNRLKEEDAKSGAVIDGYPRTLNQARLLDEMLEKLGKKLDVAIELTAPDELVFKRILERGVCSSCGAIYGIDFPPKIKGICDKCGGEVNVRTDDTKETLTKRIAIYKENSGPIIEYYKEKGVLKVVDSSNYSDNILEQII